MAKTFQPAKSIKGDYYSILLGSVVIGKWTVKSGFQFKREISQFYFSGSELSELSELIADFKKQTENI